LPDPPEDRPPVGDQEGGHLAALREAQGAGVRVERLLSFADPAQRAAELVEERTLVGGRPERTNDGPRLLVQRDGALRIAELLVSRAELNVRERLAARVARRFPEGERRLERGQRLAAAAVHRHHGADIETRFRLAHRVAGLVERGRGLLQARETAVDGIEVRILRRTEAVHELRVGGEARRIVRTGIARRPREAVADDVRARPVDLPGVTAGMGRVPGEALAVDLEDVAGLRQHAALRPHQAHAHLPGQAFEARADELPRVGGERVGMPLPPLQITELGHRPVARHRRSSLAREQKGQYDENPPHAWNTRTNKLWASLH
jgi:hypothetical protein